jgi:pyruvate dehydrogenase E1 component beta subunit
MSKITVREAIRDAMAEEMRRDEKVFVIGEEVAEYQGAYKVTQGLLQEFSSKRVIDAPITEHGFAGLAVGAAMSGLRPIVEFMTFNFAMQAIDQIINSAAKTHYMSGGGITCPIVFRGPNGAAAGVAAQHSQNFAAWYSHIPGLKVVAPYSADDHSRLLKASIRDNGPVVFLENEILYNQEFDRSEDKSIDDMDQKDVLGKAEILREGKDITVVSFSVQLNLCMEAADQLSKNQGVECEVINLRSIQPIDKNLIINSVKKTNRIVIVEEGWFPSGVAATISSIVNMEAFDYLDSPAECVCGNFTPLPYAKNLESLALPSVDKIISACKKACYIT